MPSVAGSPLSPARQALPAALDEVYGRLEQVESTVFAGRICIGQLYRTTGVSVPYNTPTIVPWQAVSDPITSEGCWSAGNPGRYIIPQGRTGWWSFTVTANWEYPSVTTNRLVTSIYRNTNAPANCLGRNEMRGEPATQLTYTVTCQSALNAGDEIFLELYHIHGNGNPLSWGFADGGANIGQPWQSRLTGLFLGPLA